MKECHFDCAGLICSVLGYYVYVLRVNALFSNSRMLVRGRKELNDGLLPSFIKINIRASLRKRYDFVMLFCLTSIFGCFGCTYARENGGEFIYLLR